MAIAHGPRTSQLLLLGLISAAALAAMQGCRGGTPTLETGYEFQPLNSTSVQRRAFYSDPYSLEARRAESERQQRDRDTGGFPGLGGQ